MSAGDDFRTKEFDLAGEMEFFSEPVTEVKPYEWLDADMRLWIEGYPDSLDGKRILDIGAGEALQGILVCERYSPKLFVALELVPQRLLAAARRANELEALEVIAGDAYRLPFADATFDVVIGNGALHHMPQPEKVASEIARVLKPGGVFFGREPNFYNLAVRYRVLHGPHVSPNEWPVTEKDIKKAFEPLGFRVEISYFWRRFPFVRHKLFAVSQRIKATLVDSSRA
jgi:ubiquinone/menaquinone biosynthesis C-methylase UbiE